MSEDFKKRHTLFKAIRKHKVVAFLLMVGLLTSGYFIYRGTQADSAFTSYKTAAVARGSVSIIVSGSGQVGTSDQLTLKPQVSGDLTFVGAEKGASVSSGMLLFQINASDASRDVRNAQTSLETAQLELAQLLAPADQRDIEKAQQAISTAEDDLKKLKRTQETDSQDAASTKMKSQENLDASYESAFNTMSDTFLNLPDIITTLHDVLYDTSLAESEKQLTNGSENIAALRNSIASADYAALAKFDSFSQIAETSYDDARAKYDVNFDHYKVTSRYSSQDSISLLLDEVIETTRSISEAAKNAINMYDYWSDYRSQKGWNTYNEAVSLRSTLSSTLGTVNGQLTKLLSSQSGIRSDTESIQSAEQSLANMVIDQPLALAAAERKVQDAKDALTDLQAPPDDLTVRSKKIQIQQAEQNLLSARQKLSDYSIYAQFEGVIADVGVTRGESVSSGTELATLITKQKIATITLNEVDISKVRVGQKATITFDAIDNLSVTGEVADVDTLSTTSQGVVTYDATVVFDVQDERVRPGMSVSVDIITDRTSGVLTVPNAAIKSQGASSYVEVMQPDGIVQRQTVLTGLAGDTTTEVTDGLSEGDMVVTQTIAPASGQAAPQSTSSILPSGGGRGIGGGSGAFVGR